MKKRIAFYLNLKRFYERGLWLDVPQDASWGRRLLTAVMRRLVLTVRAFVSERMTYRAAALTYSTLFSIVPLLAIIFAIARGFGLDAFIEERIRENFAAQPEMTDMVMGFVRSYLEHTQGGVFLGVGILLLLWTLTSLTNSIETTFNQIWQVKRERSTFRKITDYTAVFFLLPIFIVVTSGLPIFVSTFVERLPDILLLRPALVNVFRLAPYVLMCLTFTAMYAFMPNTRVSLRSAFTAGLPAGIAFQALQVFYIHSQLWVTSYNAIYGSFAALPLFLLWCQLSWYVCLFGATLSYVDQNIDSFYYGKEMPAMSRRYHDYLCMNLAAAVCRRFAEGRRPPTAAALAEGGKTPIRLATDILYELCRAGLLIEVAGDEKGESPRFIPARDIHCITPAVLFRTLDAAGGALDRDESAQDDGRWRAYREYRNRLFCGGFADTPLHKLTDRLTLPEDDTHTDTHSR